MDQAVKPVRQVKEAPETLPLQRPGSAVVSARRKAY